MAQLINSVVKNVSTKKSGSPPSLKLLLAKWEPAFSANWPIRLAMRESRKTQIFDLLSFGDPRKSKIFGTGTSTLFVSHFTPKLPSTEGFSKRGL